MHQVQLVLSVKNANFLRALLLDGLTVSVYEAATGLKLGTAAQGSLVIGARTRTLGTTLCTTLHHPMHHPMHHPPCNCTYLGCSPTYLGCNPVNPGCYAHVPRCDDQHASHLGRDAPGRLAARWGAAAAGLGVPEPQGASYLPLTTYH